LTCSYTITVTVLWLNACPTFSAPYTEAETFYRSFGELLFVDTEVTDSDDTDWTRNAQINIAGVVSNSCASSPNCDVQMNWLRFLLFDRGDLGHYYHQVGRGCEWSG